MKKNVKMKTRRECKMSVLGTHLLPIQFSYKLANRVVLSQIPETITCMLFLKLCPKTQEFTLH